MTKSKKIAVVLSGCGVYDGAEIHESVFALWAIASAGASYDIYAPDVQQHHVINHLNGQEMPEKRNVLIEAARIARGDIQPVSELNATKADAILFPGGFGVAKNLCSFAVDGADCQVNPELEKVVKDFHQAGKPIGALCISPVLITKVLGNPEVTIGSDADTAKAIEEMGGKHVNTSHAEVVVDATNKIVSTPCYMLDANILQIADGAKKAVDTLIKML
ncbi:isoprenoid biosynthesis glyoxalase ElbB [Geofilum rubicundum]|uniref:Sigma cross-reacting protein 27A n=1 Tax=Geofilum rubicundum JCM 15548 TaxID=1236989 RepID=A0A0E9M203_9BACT|nr:isoprenoid biosynthesis glyoxalase ElbB [Geofilum rubicundum]GAO31539.1 sigma cross-reacting protein 27A [Geofilum rubicundum JCM 15548]